MNRRSFFFLLISCLFLSSIDCMILLQPQEAVNFIQYQLRQTHQAALDASSVELLQQQLRTCCSSADYLQGSAEELYALLQSVYQAHDWWIALLQSKMEELLPHCVVCKEVCTVTDGNCYVLVCRHYSHKNCLLQWFANKPYKRHTMCPECMIPLGASLSKSLSRKRGYKQLVQKAYEDWSINEMAEVNNLADVLRREELAAIEVGDALFAQQLARQFRDEGYDTHNGDAPVLGETLTPPHITFGNFHASNGIREEGF